MLPHDILLRKPNVKLAQIRSLLYRRIFEFCFLLRSPNPFQCTNLASNLACARKKRPKNANSHRCAKMRATRRAQNQRDRTQNFFSEDSSKCGTLLTLPPPGAFRAPRLRRLASPRRTGSKDAFKNFFIFFDPTDPQIFALSIAFFL